MWMSGVYIAIAAIAFWLTISIAAAFLFIQWKRRNHGSCKNTDLELQQLSLSVRTTSKKKISFEGSNYDYSFNGRQTIDQTTPHKTLVETYSIQELRKATEDFSSTNFIEDWVYSMVV
ncbi:hypothetical protein ACH5RR_014541 [Cinchona calisaya]|uniref:Uncharacterized protein n=1 Tax=Cinchona calisaya TaxID=153742 RepID=A0ABD3A354_9GENT